MQEILSDIARDRYLAEKEYTNLHLGYMYAKGENDKCFYEQVSEGAVKDREFNKDMKMSFDKYSEINKKRARITLQALRQRGYCTETTAYSMLDKIEEEEHNAFMKFRKPTFVSGIMNSVYYILFQYYCDNFPNENYPNVINDISLDKDIYWTFGIETTLSLHEEKAVADDEIKNLCRYALPYIKEIYIFTILYGILDTFGEFFHEKQGAIKEYSDKLLSDTNIIEQLNALETIRIDLEDEREAFEEEKKKFEKEREDYKEQIASLQRQLKACNSELHDLKKENETLEQITEALNYEIEMSDGSDEGEADIEKKIELLDQIEKVTLPARHVVFMGGHQRVVAALAQRYPKWSYLSDESKAKASDETGYKPEIVFIWSGHLSHGTMYKVMSNIPKDVPIGYVTATNINLLEQQMKAQILKLRKGN